MPSIRAAKLLLPATIRKHRGLLPNPLLLTIEQSGKAIPSARKLDPLTRSHVSPAPAPSANPYRIKLSMRHSANVGMIRALFPHSPSRWAATLKGAPRPGTAQRPGTRELPDFCSTGGYKKVFERSLQEPLSLPALYVEGWATGPRTDN